MVACTWAPGGHGCLSEDTQGIDVEKGGPPSALTCPPQPLLAPQTGHEQTVLCPSQPPDPVAMTPEHCVGTGPGALPPLSPHPPPPVPVPGPLTLTLVCVCFSGPGVPGPRSPDWEPRGPRPAGLTCLKGLWAPQGSGMDEAAPTSSDWKGKGLQYVCLCVHVSLDLPPPHAPRAYVVPWGGEGSGSRDTPSSGDRSP